MSWLAALGRKLLEVVGPYLIGGLVKLVQDWLAQRRAKKAQEQADKDIEESKKTGRPKWDE